VELAEIIKNEGLRVYQDKKNLSVLLFKKINKYGNIKLLLELMASENLENIHIQIHKKLLFCATWSWTKSRENEDVDGGKACLHLPSCLMTLCDEHPGWASYT
jgi:hypothetical protein